MRAAFKDAAYLKKEQDYRREHGQTPLGSQVSGLRMYRPTDVDGHYLPINSIYMTEHGPVKLYDSTVRVVDSEVFNHEYQEYEERQKDVEELAYKFLRSGDILCLKYLGPPFFEMLSEGGAPRPAWLESDGYPKDTASRIVAELAGIDAKPSIIRTLNEASPQYTAAINKLLSVIRYSGIVFTGRKSHPNPDNGVPSGETLFDARADELSTKAKAENEARVNRRNL